MTSLITEGELALEKVWTTLRDDAVVAEKWLVAEVTGLEAELAAAIALPFWRAIEPIVLQDLETALRAVMAEAGMALEAYLTGGTISLATIEADLLNKAQVLGLHTVVALEPYAFQAWLGLKALAARAEGDVKAAVAAVAKDL